MNKENRSFIDEFNPFRLCREILQQWKRILAVAVIAAVIVLPLSLLQVKRTYQASFQMLVDIPGLFQQVAQDENLVDDTVSNNNKMTADTPDQDATDADALNADAEPVDAAIPGANVPAPQPNKPQNNTNSSDKKELDALEASTMRLQNLTNTYVNLLSSNIVLQPVVESLDLDIEYKDLRYNFSAQTMGTSPIITVTIWNDDAKVVEEIAEETARLAPDILHDVVSEGTCKVISKPLIEKYSSTFSIVKSNTIQAAVLGAFLTILWICVRFLMNNYIEDDSDVKKYLDLPLVGVIPSVKEVQ